MVSCASKAKPESKDQIVGVMANETDDLLNHFFKKSAETEFLNDDQVKVEVLLQIPEVEIPRGERAEKALGGKRVEDKGIHVFNGHICVQAKVVSAKKVDYSKTNWQTEVRVDEKPAKVLVESRPKMQFDFTKKSATPIPGETDIRVCTVGKFPKVTKVQFRLKNLAHLSADQFVWSTPWPIGD